MQNYLELLSKTILNTESAYTFSCSNKTITLPHDKAVKLINQYASNDRNCRICSNAIQLKQGKLPVKYAAAEPAGKIVQIYTPLKQDIQLYKSRNYIESNDSAFSQWADDADLIKSCEKYIREIDHVQQVDYVNLKAVSPFGVIEFPQFSTGLKTVLNIAHLRRYEPETEYMVNINECGPNAVRYVYECSYNSRIILYTEHHPISFPDKYTYYVNDRKAENIRQFSQFLLK